MCILIFHIFTILKRFYINWVNVRIFRICVIFNCIQYIITMLKKKKEENQQQQRNIEFQ